MYLNVRYPGWSLSDLKSLTARQRKYWTEASEFVIEQRAQRGVR
jgi:hypothetical protein